MASAVVEASGACPARGLEFTLYRREVAGSRPAGADFEVNANGGPRMPTTVQLDATAEPSFWYALDRANAHRSGLTISEPPARGIFADAPRSTLLDAMYESMAWHRAHEKATLYSVLNACRAWRFAAVDVLGSKLEAAAWARARWTDTGLIDAAVALRRGEDATLEESSMRSFRPLRLGCVKPRRRPSRARPNALPMPRSVLGLAEWRASVPHARREELECRRSGQPSTFPVMTSDEFVPVDFDPPTPLATNQFHLEPLGPQHNQADHAAWMSSIEHIRSTPGYPDGNWPPRSGMTLEENLSDLRRHADDFARGGGFTFTVLDPGDNDVIGCVYLYPSASQDWDVTVQSWVRADRSGLDVPLADAVARWLATDWPWDRVDRCGR